MAPLEDAGDENLEEAEVAREGGDVDDEQEEFQRQKVLKDPGQPTQAERDEHDITHIPYRPWCADCVRGRAKRKRSLRIRGAYSGSTCPRIRMDYCQLTETGEDSEGVGGWRACRGGGGSTRKGGRRS